MGNPVSLRNIPPHALKLAQHLCAQTGLSIADVLRQAIVSGLLIEATRVAPLENETLGGLEPARLAKALRRHLSSAIDLLLEYDEHPYSHFQSQGALAYVLPSTTQAEATQAVGPRKPDQQAIFDETIGDDLEMLGIGVGLSER